MHNKSDEKIISKYFFSKVIKFTKKMQDILKLMKNKITITQVKKFEIIFLLFFIYFRKFLNYLG